MKIKQTYLLKTIAFKIGIVLSILFILNSCTKEENEQQTIKITSKAVKQNTRLLKESATSLTAKPSCKYSVAAIGGLAEGSSLNPDYNMVVTQLQNMADLLVNRTFATQVEARAAAYNFDNEARTFASFYNMTWTPVKPDVPNLITSDCGDLDDPYLPGGGGGTGDPGGVGTPTSWNQNLTVNDIIETESELDIAGISSKNPAKITCSALLHCSAYLGSGAPMAIVESVDMSMTVVNGSSTTYLPDGTEDTWYTTLTNKSYEHSPYGFPTITLTWNATKIVRHTVTRPGQSPVSKVTQRPVPPTTRVMSAYLP
ncbi:hypothetical protein [Chryseobacterium herbae]|uniref:Lipoprotein n=1 Tax=Chryseobacterium herbae TaxID=2976476 RepID=A0ABT2ISG1_9FLAO|nr:hypothetical protein [Chryseobacterium sp. pc1-10]MCT2561765.1 hypothetical protein [Chryseobacterium sp. pc1-10]